MELYYTFFAVFCHRLSDVMNLILSLCISFGPFQIIASCAKMAWNLKGELFQPPPGLDQGYIPVTFLLHSRVSVRF